MLKRHWKVTATVMCAVAAMLWLFAKEAFTSRSQQNPAQPSPVPVRCARAKTGTVQKRVRLFGVLAPSQTVAVSPKTAGRLEKVLVEVGSQVKKGSLVAALETKEIEAQLRQAEAALQAAQANLARAQKGASPEELAQLEAVVAQADATLSAARSSYYRTKALFEAGVVSRQQFEQAETQMKVAEAQYQQAYQRLAQAKAGASQETLDAAQAQVKQAEAARDLASIALSNAQLKAPVSGTVLETHGEPGELVAAGTPIAVLACTDPLLLDLNAPEHLAPVLKQEDPVELKVEAASADSLGGKVKWVSPAASTQSRLFKVRVEVPNPTGALRPGMFAEAWLVESSKSGVVVPEEALMYARQNSSQATAFIVDGGIAKARTVSVLLSNGKLAVVSGISEGELLVLAGQTSLEDGTPVEVIEEE
ncbi:MAG: efflux RND transporter periplasmic adaptor subunit [Bacillota bacterium]